MGGLGGETNPEQLFAAGWASCFQDRPGEFSLSAAVHVELGGLDRTAADSLIEAAHALCPYSNATRGNIQVTIDVVTGAAAA